MYLLLGLSRLVVGVSNLWKWCCLRGHRLEIRVVIYKNHLSISILLRACAARFVQIFLKMYKCTIDLCILVRFNLMLIGCLVNVITWWLHTRTRQHRCFHLYLHLFPVMAQSQTPPFQLKGSRYDQVSNDINTFLARMPCPACQCQVILTVCTFL